MFEKKRIDQTRREKLLRPAFDSAGQMSAFLMLMALTLALPALLSYSGRFARSYSYEIMPENQGAFSFVRDEIFVNDEPVDLVFAGSSVLFSGIDTPQVERALSDKIGRPARVMTFGHYFNSLDIVYMQIRDLVERKKVRMVVLSIPRLPYPDGPSPIAYRFMRYDDAPEVFEALPLGSKLSLYACSVLRSPRDVLSLLRTNLDKAPSPFAKNLGADKADWGRFRNPSSFVRFAPPSPSLGAEQMIYSPANADRFNFTGEAIPTHQRIYLEKLVELLRREQIPFAFVNIPQYTERESSTIIERQNWSAEPGFESPLIGVAPSVLFAGLNEEEKKRLYYDDMHFNSNGSEFFTKTILPAVLKVYEEKAATNR